MKKKKIYKKSYQTQDSINLPNEKTFLFLKQSFGG